MRLTNATEGVHYALQAAASRLAPQDQPISLVDRRSELKNITADSRAAPAYGSCSASKQYDRNFGLNPDDLQGSTHGDCGPSLGTARAKRASWNCQVAHHASRAIRLTRVGLAE